MADYPLVQIGDLFLTDDGLETGQPCRVDVAGLDAFSTTSAGQSTEAADGTPYLFVSEDGGIGALLRFQMLVTLSSLLDDLKELVQDAITAEDTINVQITGSTGTFDLEMLPAFPPKAKGPIEFPGDFSDDKIFNVALNFVVDSIN